MNADQADVIAKRIINTFRLTPALVEWREVLAKLELDDALITFRHLRDEITDGGLTIGRYLGAYRGRIDTRRRDHERRDPPPRCEQCAGTGWVDAPPLLAHRPTTCRGQPGTDTCHCTAMTPCACTTGQRMTAVEARIHDQNTR